MTLQNGKFSRLGDTDLLYSLQCGTLQKPVQSMEKLTKFLAFRCLSQSAISHLQWKNSHTDYSWLQIWGNFTLMSCIRHTINERCSRVISSPALCPEDPGFRSQLGSHTHSHEAIRGFTKPSMQFPAYVFLLRHEKFFLHPFQFIIYK
jgi:hypothetical protein